MVQVTGGREPTRRELFRAYFSTDGIAKNEETANSKVIGKDNNGLVDLYGLGVRAYDVWGIIPSRAARRRDKLMYKFRCDQLSCELAQLKARDSQRQGSSKNASFGANIVNEPQPLLVCIYLN
ncbi:transposase, Ptta/En/Spm [Artemisia annua]|uniref:Transposase, Ptta/En/Spm n=1 Tax=Artemisia annua TaxID=35608 RepID=A0A2U1NF84_ARTAN|nr:transposase, Ptta/En/Spm [Artemisia annua]